MNRLLVPLVALSMGATLLVASTASAQVAAPPNIVRGTVAVFTASTTPKVDRTFPYTFTTRGRIAPPPRYCAPGTFPTATVNCVPSICPPGATDFLYCLLPGRTSICSGVVTVRFQKVTTTISSRQVTIAPDCTYVSRVTFKLNTPTRRGTLNVRARFQGNVVLLPISSKTRKVRTGP